MRIGIDARKAADYGIGTYVRNLARELVRLEGRAEWVFLHRPGDEALLPPAGERVRLAPEPAGNYSLRELRVLAGRARELRLDLFHAPHYVLPFGLPCPAVVTVHDLIHLVDREYRGPRRLYARFMIGHATRAAARVLTVSHSSERDLVRAFPRAAGKIRVVPNGVEGRFHPRSRVETAARIGAEFGVRGPYLLFVGNPKPHKNFGLLLEGFSRLARRYPELWLVAAGGEEARRREIGRRVGRLGLAGRVRLLGAVPAGDLAHLYAGAAAFVFPSRYEGFGLPPLEAMACGTPVASSNASSLPEVLGPAARYFSPESVDSLVAAVCRILDEPEGRDRLVRLGEERARLFTWEEAAARTLAVYAEALGDEP